jgi:hypothetical protein
MNFYTGLKPCVNRTYSIRLEPLNIKIDVIKLNWCFYDFSATKTPKHKISETFLFLLPFFEDWKRLL